MDDIKVALIDIDLNDETQNNVNDQQIQVRFQPARSARHLPTTPSTFFSVPVTLGRVGLSELVNHLLELTTPKTFEFLINNKFLRVSLEKYLSTHNLTLEDELEIEYIEATPPPDRDQSTPHPDWVSSVDSTIGISKTMLPTTNKKKSTDEQITYTEQDGILSVVGCYDHIVRVWSHSLYQSPTEHDLFTKTMSNHDQTQKFQKSNYSLVAQGAGHHAPVTTVRVARPFLHSTPTTTSLLLSGSIDKTARLWELSRPIPSSSTTTKQDPTTTQPKAQKLNCLGIFDYHVGTVTTVETLFHPNRPNSLVDTTLGGSTSRNVIRFLTAGYDGAIALWSNSNEYKIDQETVEEQFALMNKGMGRKLKAQKTHAMQTAAKLTSIDEELTLPHYKPQTAYMGHRGAISSLIWPNPQSFYSGGYDATIKLWDLERSKYIHAWSGGHVVNCLDFSSTLNLIASGDQDGHVRLWDPRIPSKQALDGIDSDDEEGIQMTRLPMTKTNKGQFKACDSWVSSVKFTPTVANTPYYLITTGYDGKAKLWDIRSAKPLHIVDTNSERLLCGDIVPSSQPDKHTVDIFSVCGGTGRQVDRLHWSLNVAE